MHEFVLCAPTGLHLNDETVNVPVIGGGVGGGDVPPKIITSAVDDLAGMLQMASTFTVPEEVAVNFPSKEVPKIV